MQEHDGFAVAFDLVKDGEAIDVDRPVGSRCDHATSLRCHTAAGPERRTDIGRPGAIGAQTVKVG